MPTTLLQAPPDFQTFLRPLLHMYYIHKLGTEMFAQGGFFMKQNAYVPESGNEGGRGATPNTSISIFDFYDMKTL